MSYFVPMRPSLIALALGALLVASVAAAQSQRNPFRDRFSGFFLSDAPDDALALLLPLSGSQAAAGLAIRDGFLAAATVAGDRVRVYDAGSGVDSAVYAFDLLQRRRPAVIVGPLHKGAVAAIAERREAGPWLALNYLDHGQSLPDMLQFGLAPEDEARAAAEHARSLGLRRALALAPDGNRSEWGERALRAFSTRLLELGGELLGVGRYPDSTLNFSATIKQLLGLDASAERHRQVSGTLGVRPEFEPRRRDDADFLFIAARAEDGRLLWPQLRFHRVGELPAYATSAIYEGRQDQELNGVRVCDMPYLADASGFYAKLRADAETLPSAHLQPRLFAFGYDAYGIAARMRDGEPLRDRNLPGASGRLQIGDGVVGRGLNCADIRDGRPAGAAPAA
jgi:uncharacterized protein